jgi:hypothetical protein
MKKNQHANIRTPVVLVLLLFTGCGSPPADNKAAVSSPTPVASPSPTSKPLSPEASVAEQEYQLPADYEVIAVVRREAGEWAMKQNPGWQVKGVSCLNSPSNSAYFVDVDLSRNKDTQVVRLYMQAMFASNGTYYWKATPITLSQRIGNSPTNPSE